MKKKLSLLFLALVATIGAWAIDVKIAETSSGLPTAAGFGSFSEQVFTTAADSGLEGVTVTASTGLTIGEQTVNAANYGNCFKLVTAAASTNYQITLSAPEGYVITGYSMQCSANSNSYRHTLTSEDGTVSVEVSSPPYNSNPAAPKAFNVTGLNKQTTYFTINTANGGNTLYLPSFIIYVAKPAPVTYVISDANGVVFTSDPIIAGVGTTITTLPSSLQRAFCSYSAINHTVVEGENTINVTVSYDLPFETGTDKLYYAKLRGHYVYYDATNNDVRTNQSSNEHTDAYKWSFSGNPYDGIKVKNCEAAKYLDNTSNTVQLTEDGYAWTIHRLNNSSTFGLYNGTNHINEQNHSNHNLIYWWAFETDTGSQWNVEEVPASEVEVTYNVVLAGNIVATATEIQAVGGAPAVPASLNFAFTSYTYDIDVIPGSATTVTATPTFNMPFETSTDYATATWYYLQGHASYSDRYVSTNGTEVVWSIGKGITEAYQWAFIGNPIEGIKLINKAAGVGNYLMATNPATMGTTAKVWTLKQQTNTNWQCGANGFGLYDATLTYLNTQGSTLKYWGSFDQGSTFWVEKVPDNYASNVEAEVKPWFDDYGGYFQLKTSVVEANRTTYEDALDNCDLATYQQLLALLDDANNYVYPTTGFYRIKSSGMRIGESYIAYGQPTSHAAGLITVTAANAPTDASTILKLTGADGQYTIATQGMYAQNQTTNNVAFPMTTNAADAATFSFIPYTPGVAVITNDGTNQGYFHEAGWAVPAVVRWTAAADASHWTVEAVETLTVPLNGPVAGSYYATFCVPFDVTFNGATAYTLDRGEGTELTMSEPITEVVAGTPVLLVGTSGSATATIGSNYSNAPVSGTALTGNYFAIPFDGATNYVLGTDGTKVGFFHWDGTTLKANRAYIAGEAAGGAKGFYLDDSFATAIQKLTDAADGNAIYYDLSGRRVAEPKQGLYIVNGKKVVVK